MNSLKKAAMFGLDARIALAIFGALSIISGAALFSAIESATLTARITTINEHIKAIESLYIDTGTLQTGPDSSDSYDARDLTTDNGIEGWDGPYFSSSVSLVTLGSDDYANITASDIPSEYTHVLYRNLKNSSWEIGVDDWATDVKCVTSTDDCSLWMQWTIYDTSDTLGEKLDDKFDDGVASTGNIRTGTGTGLVSFAVKGFALNSQ